jgi:HAD superfamily hydrolase (TIGR01509 family)
VHALLVDLYDTLVWVDWRPLGDRLAARLNVDGDTLLRAFELTSTARGTGQHGSMRGDLAAIVTATGGRADDDFLATLEDELITFLGQSAHLYDDVLPALRALRAAGTRIAIVSNCDHATRPLLAHLRLQDEVDAAILSCEVRVQKPDAAIFQHALDRLGVLASQAVFVDDQPRFLAGARALGIRALRMVRASGYPTFPEDDGAHPVIADLTQLGGL